MERGFGGYMIIKEVFDKLLYLYEEVSGYPPAVTFQYSVLGEYTRLIDHYALRVNALREDEDYEPDKKEEADEDESIIWLYIDLGERYIYLGHYGFARDSLKKAVDFVKENKINFSRKEADLKAKFKTGCLKLLDIYENSKNRAAKNKLVKYLEEKHSFVLKPGKEKDEIFREKVDPVEYTEKYLKILPELEAKIEKALEGEYGDMGFCYRIWDTKEKILKNDYGIEWRNPGIMNPGVIYD
jgi:hypothetical protein